MLSSSTLFYFLEAISLDLLSLPGKLMDNEGNAMWHLEHVCSKCSRWRKSFRDPDGDGGRCLWKEEWQRGNYDFPRDFGPVNLLRYYAGLRTRLEPYISGTGKED